MGGKEAKEDKKDKEDKEDKGSFGDEEVVVFKKEHMDIEIQEKQVKQK